MEKNNRNLTTLNTIFVVSLITANACSAKIVQLGALTVPAAVVCYPLTFLMTDVIGEIWGKEEANETVKRGFFCQLIASLMILVALRLPSAAFNDIQAEFTTVLGSTFRIFIASMVAYLCSQSFDVFVFHKVRDAYIAKKGSRDGGRWLWNNISTMSSQLVDTVIFITIAFYGVVPSLLTMIAGQYVIKLCYAALDTPFFYLLTNDRKKKAEADMI